MSSVDSIWADMQKESKIVMTEKKKEKIGIVTKQSCKSSAVKKTKKSEKVIKAKKDKKANIENCLNLVSYVSQAEDTIGAESNEGGEPPELSMTPEELVMRLQRPIQQTKDENLSIRRSAMQYLHDLLLHKLKDKLPDSTMNLLLDELSKPILRRFGDSGAEKIRELAVDIMTYLIKRCRNLVGLLPYLFPVVMDRLGRQYGFDTETNIFIHDVEAHEKWKRGAAVSRQDQAANGTHGVAVVTVIEPSEEIRLRLLKLMTSLLEETVRRGTSNLIHPYFHDSILFIQAHLRDPFPDIKLEACRSLTVLARQPCLNQGMVYYALAIARATLPVLRHRHAKVRCAAVRLVTASIAVPYKAKCRGAGTDAVVDLIGYNAEDSIPIAAFYGGHTSVNYLAELTVDRVVSVRLETAKMLAEFITSLPDRYDHRTRLVPFLLNAVNDEDEQVCEVAMKALAIAGAEYERENESDIIERRQYGVDGDRRALHDEKLPSPFKERPRLGERLYVRGCTRRFIKPLLGELTDWKSKTKLSSAGLMRTVIVYCEEALTQDLNVLVPSLCTAFKCLQPDEGDVFKVLSECCELLGRFIAPDSYVPFLLPRLKGELAVLPTGTDGSGRALVLLLAKLFMQGSSPKELVKHAEELCLALTDEVVLTSGIFDLKSRALHACGSLVNALDQSGAALEAHYLTSGRLAHKTRLLESLVYGLLIWRHDPTLRGEANTILARLACVEARDDAVAKPNVRRFNELLRLTPLKADESKELEVCKGWLVEWLVCKYAEQISARACSAYPLDVLWEVDDVSHIVLSELMCLISDPPTMVNLLVKLDTMFNGLVEAEEEIEDVAFWDEWASLISTCCSRFLQCSDHSEGLLQNYLLSILRRLCLERVTKLESPNNSSRFEAVASFLQLGDHHSWNQIRRKDALACTGILSGFLSPSAQVSMRCKSCSAIGQLVRVGVKGRLKSFQKMKKSQNVRSEWLDVACSVYDPLLLLLQDPVEGVRIEAARALQDILFFVSPTGSYCHTREKDSVDEEWVSLSDLKDDNLPPKNQFISFDDFLRCVVPLLRSDTDGDWSVEESPDASLDAVDVLLQQSAVIDPAAFMSRLSEFAPLMGRLSELESHGELLMSFEEGAAKDGPSTKTSPDIGIAGPQNRANDLDLD
jgi:hypothetical protein